MMKTELKAFRRTLEKRQGELGTSMGRREDLAIAASLSASQPATAIVREDLSDVVSIAQIIKAHVDTECLRVSDRLGGQR